MTRFLTILLLCALCGCSTAPVVKQSLTPAPAPPMPGPGTYQTQTTHAVGIVAPPQPTPSVFAMSWPPGTDTTVYDIPAYSADLTVPMAQWPNYGVAFLDYTNQSNWSFLVTNFEPQMFYTVILWPITAGGCEQFPTGVTPQP